MIDMKRNETYLSFFDLSKKKKMHLYALIDADDDMAVDALFRRKKRDSVPMEEPLDGDMDIANRVRPIPALQYAYQEGKKSALTAMMKCGMDPAERFYYLDRSLLEELIYRNDLDTMKEILPFVQTIDEMKVFPAGPHFIQTTYMGLCAYLGRTEATKLLMERGFHMVPFSTEEALAQDRDCIGTYNGGVGERLEDENRDYHCTALKNLLIEPWQFAVLSDDTEAAEFFLKFGKDGETEGFRELICHVRNEDMLNRLEQHFPQLMTSLLQPACTDLILKMANGQLLRRCRGTEFDLTKFGALCREPDQICDCYQILKMRLDRELRLEEKEQLIGLMLKTRSEKILRICEAEWKEEAEPCDVTEWAGLLPACAPADKPFTEMLERSPLRLMIHPEHKIFERGFCDINDFMRSQVYVSCLDHCRNLAVLDRVVEVRPPEHQGAELLPFTERVLNMGKKTAFRRLRKWGLIHSGNMSAVMEYIVDHGLKEYYDQAIRSAEKNGKGKEYRL